MDDDVDAKSSRCGDKRKAPPTVEKPQKKPWGTEGPPPPEWIEMMRKKKVTRLAEKEKRRIELGLPDPRAEPPETFNHNVIQRPLLRLPGFETCVNDSKRVTIMTYNVLAQSLIRRRLFPSSGDALKWKHRSKMLTNELKYYQPTIMCLQEVDLEQYEPYFVSLLQSLQYDHILLAAKKKRQGLLIAWKTDKLELLHRKNIHYDLLSAGTVGPIKWTGNVGLCLGLKCKDSPRRGIWISNTHLFWHPRGSYERQRQAGLLVSETTTFATQEPQWPIVICGDFNSTPWGMTYTALTKRPISLTHRQQLELSQSVEYDFRQVKDEEEEFPEDSDIPSTDMSTPGDIDSWETLKPGTSEATAAPQFNQLPESITVREEPLNVTPATMENNSLVLQHHASNPPLKSLYSMGLKLCQPDNAINAHGEPPVTNWAHGYKETLDYIFIVQNEMKHKVKLTGLLKMPRLEEMGEGEPQEGRFPSDHVCEMVEVELS